jgi:hypothetical protein
MNRVKELKALWRYCPSHHDTPILHCRVKIVTQWVSATKGKSGFDFYICKIKVIKKWI